jgi:hypothetical protein
MENPYYKIFKQELLDIYTVSVFTEWKNCLILDFKDLNNSISSDSKVGSKGIKFLNAHFSHNWDSNNVLYFVIASYLYEPDLKIKEITILFQKEENYFDFTHKSKNIFKPLPLSIFYGKSFVDSKNSFNSWFDVSFNKKLSLLEETKPYSKKVIIRFDNVPRNSAASYLSDLTSYYSKCLNVSVLTIEYVKNVQGASLDLDSLEDLIFFFKRFSIYDDFVITSSSPEDNSFLKTYINNKKLVDSLKASRVKNFLNKNKFL